MRSSEPEQFDDSAEPDDAVESVVDAAVSGEAPVLNIRHIQGAEVSAGSVAYSADPYDEEGMPIPAPQGPTAAPPDRRGRRMRAGTKRALFVALGVVVLLLSVLGFYITSDVFDSRTQVMVAAGPIEAGQILAFTDFGFDEAAIGSIPHLPWTSDSAYQFEGMVALQPIPAGALVRADMFTAAETVPVGVELEAIVPLDLTLVTGSVFEGTTVLLVDPGVEPTESAEGRPRRVVREFELTNFDESANQMQLFVSPEEWAEWDSLLDEVGGTLMVVDLGVGAEPAETARRLDTVWLTQWTTAAQETLRAADEAAGVVEMAPGELEVIVALDASLSPSGVSDGDTVLLIDPGAVPAPGAPGRPRSVISTLVLENYSNGQMRIYVPPEEWVYWQSLPEQLGTTPQVLPVIEGTDIDLMIEELNTLWREAWREALAAAS